MMSKKKVDRGVETEEFLTAAEAYRKAKDHLTVAEDEYKKAKKNLCNAVKYLAEDGEEMLNYEIAHILGLSAGATASVLRSVPSRFVPCTRSFVECDVSGNPIPGAKVKQTSHFYRAYGLR